MQVNYQKGIHRKLEMVLNNYDFFFGSKIKGLVI